MENKITKRVSMTSTAAVTKEKTPSAQMSPHFVRLLTMVWLKVSIKHELYYGLGLLIQKMW